MDANERVEMVKTCLIERWERGDEGIWHARTLFVTFMGELLVEHADALSDGREPAPWHVSAEEQTFDDCPLVGRKLLELGRDLGM